MLTTARKALPPLAAAVVSLLVMSLLSVGAGPLPGLGRVLSPGAGVWDSAADGRLPRSRTVRLDTLGAPVTVAFDARGVPAVRAASDEDLFRAQGYLHAVFRLTQMDLERRMGAGRLAELQGAGAVESDEFQLRSGLLRTAEATWRATQRDSPAGRALIAYSEGVNARLAELRASGNWPAMFTLTGVYPKDWTPVDSLVVQGLLTQYMSYSTAPLAYELLKRSLGAKRTMEWFPVTAPNEQHPYDPGPYRYLGMTRLPLSANANASVPEGPARAQSPAPSGRSRACCIPPEPREPASPRDHSAEAAADILRTVQALPAAEAQAYANSNAWVARGTAVAGGRALLAGDPHLELTLPSFWYEIALSSPSTEVTGASLTGLPGVLIGHNRDISWSITNVQNQSTLFYKEKTSPDRPGQYFWRGAWRDMRTMHYSIPVRGAAARKLTVELTAHGPVMTQAGQTTSVSWMGNVPSFNVEAILRVNKARDYRQFRAALARWHAPTLNFAYADGRGNIGMFAAGYFPLTKAREPWFVLPGTGEYDIEGTIPYEAAPQAYNPTGDILVTANQRPVGPDYPYYIGTTAASFDNGYRASRIHDALAGRRAMTVADFTALQTDVTDELATRVLPKVREALDGAALDAGQRRALDLLGRWNLRMTAGSSGAAIWWTFWNEYLSVVFQPWWDAAGVPVDDGEKAMLRVSSARAGLNQNLEKWTLSDQDNPAFTAPGAARGDAVSAIRKAFARAVTELSGKLGTDPSRWTWGNLHTTGMPALSGTAALGEAPRPAPGNRWTVNTAVGEPSSSFGPSLRMVVHWTGPHSVDARAVYPGGQSENPASPWYRNQVPHWWSGRTYPMRSATARSDSTITWTLRPGE